MARPHYLLPVLGVISSLCSVNSLHFEFTPPDAVLQASYPAGFRAFIPDFPGCEMFSFHGKLNSPFVGDELGTFNKDILRPQRGLWAFEDTNAVLTPGDVLHYWTTVIKDKTPFHKKNLTWTVPDPNDAVDFLTPSVMKPPKPTPLKMVAPELTTDENEEPTEEEPQTLPPTFPEIVASVLELAANKTTPTPSTTAPTPTTTTPTPTTTTPTPTTTTPTPSITTPTPSTTTTTTKPPPTTTETTTSPSPSTTKRPAPSEKPKAKPKKSTPPMTNPLLAEDVEELTTPALPFEKPIATEFPQEPPLFPFPPLFPRPFKPLMPPASPGFEICSNPWNFEEQPGESRAQRLERQVAKLQCELALFQRGTSRLGSTVENEISDLKKLVYGLVGRMARLEQLLRTSPFG